MTFYRQVLFDFLLTEHNIAIEYDGRQHFEKVDRWGGEKAFIQIQKLDKLKDEFSRKNGWNMLRISYLDFDKTEQILCEHILKK